jgi:hypothetical protein
MSLKQAAEMALKYFEDAHGLEDAELEIKEALRQALTHPEQKYVIDCPRCGHCCPGRQWVGLETQEIGQIWFKHKEVYGFGIELEQVLKGRNT